MSGAVGIVVVLAFTLLAPVSAAEEPSDGGPAPGLVVTDGWGPEGQPFLDELVYLQSPGQPTGFSDQRATWSCRVDPGDGVVRDGYWRAPRHSTIAPCTLAHTYGEVGSYTATMVVTDPEGRSATTVQEITVTRRPVERVSGLVEGDRVGLPPAEGGGQWQVAGPEATDLPCVVDQPTSGTDGVGRCYDEGLVRFHLNAVDGTQSRAVEVEYVNGAPAPGRIRLLFRGGSERERPDRLRVGDRYRVTVAHRDPSLAPRPGPVTHVDRLRCRAALEGEVVRVVRLGITPRCEVVHTWSRPGRHVLKMAVRDDAGAVGVSTRVVRVVPRGAR